MFTLSISLHNTKNSFCCCVAVCSDGAAGCGSSTCCLCNLLSIHIIARLAAKTLCSKSRDMIVQPATTHVVGTIAARAFTAGGWSHELFCWLSGKQISWINLDPCPVSQAMVWIKYLIDLSSTVCSWNSTDKRVNFHSGFAKILSLLIWHHGSDRPVAVPQKVHRSGLLLCPDYLTSFKTHWSTFLG